MTADQAEEAAVMQLIAERDEAEKIADDLTAAIAEHLGANFGEHSSANSPWINALDAISDAPKRDKPYAYTVIDFTDADGAPAGREADRVSIVLDANLDRAHAEAADMNRRDGAAFKVYALVEMPPTTRDEPVIADRPCIIAVVGDVYPALECFRDEPDAQHGQHITFVEAGTSWDDMVAAVRDHSHEDAQ